MPNIIFTILGAFLLHTKRTILKRLLRSNQLRPKTNKNVRYLETLSPSKGPNLRPTWCPEGSASCHSPATVGDVTSLFDRLLTFLSKEMLFGIAPVDFGFSDWTSCEIDFWKWTPFGSTKQQSSLSVLASGAAVILIDGTARFEKCEHLLEYPNHHFIRGDIWW